MRATSTTSQLLEKALQTTWVAPRRGTKKSGSHAAPQTEHRTKIQPLILVNLVSWHLVRQMDG